jgi:hypothetical protein
MSALVVSLALFAAAWLLHFGWWRISLPHHHTQALLAVFALTPLACAGLWLALGRPAFISAAEVPSVLAFYTGAAGCYVITYTGVEQSSPSLTIVRALESAGEKGCSQDELAAMITQDQFVAPRIEAMRRDGLLTVSAAGFSLTPRGRRAARTALAFSKLFNVRENA